MADTPQNDAVEDDARRKFREALERKDRKGASRQAQGDIQARIQGSTNPAGGKRYFRRKTG
ncbi:DUF5302 domain-containing protein [Streptomyces sp. NPDC054847]